MSGSRVSLGCLKKTNLDYFCLSNMLLSVTVCTMFCFGGDFYILAINNRFLEEVRGYFM